MYYILRERESVQGGQQADTRPDCQFTRIGCHGVTSPYLPSFFCQIGCHCGCHGRCHRNEFMSKTKTKVEIEVSFTLKSKLLTDAAAHKPPGWWSTPAACRLVREVLDYEDQRLAAMPNLRGRRIVKAKAKLPAAHTPGLWSTPEACRLVREVLEYEDARLAAMPDLRGRRIVKGKGQP